MKARAKQTKELPGERALRERQSASVERENRVAKTLNDWEAKPLPSEDEMRRDIINSSIKRLRRSITFPTAVIERNDAMAESMIAVILLLKKIERNTRPKSKKPK